MLLLLLPLLPLATGLNTSTTDRGEGRNIPIFNIISFPNAPCAATSGFNGTCYTASECLAKSGTARYWTHSNLRNRRYPHLFES